MGSQQFFLERLVNNDLMFNCISSRLHCWLCCLLRCCHEPFTAASAITRFAASAAAYGFPMPVDRPIKFIGRSRALAHKGFQVGRCCCQFRLGSLSIVLGEHHLPVGPCNVVDRPC